MVGTGVARQRGDGETGRRGDGETGRRRDGEMGMGCRVVGTGVARQCRMQRRCTVIVETGVGVGAWLQRREEKWLQESY